MAGHPTQAIHPAARGAAALALRAGDPRRGGPEKRRQSGHKLTRYSLRQTRLISATGRPWRSGLEAGSKRLMHSSQQILGRAARRSVHAYANFKSIRGKPVLRMRGALRRSSRLLLTCGMRIVGGGAAISASLITSACVSSHDISSKEKVATGAPWTRDLNEPPPSRPPVRRPE